MINPFILNPNERIKIWRDLREEIKFLNFEEQLEKVSKFWWQAPMQTYAIDFDRPETWPTPWEMIYQNGYDTSARALMMAETFILAFEGKEFDKFELHYIKDYVVEDMIMILNINGYVLNHQYNMVLQEEDLDGHYQIYSSYKKNGKGWELI